MKPINKLAAFLFSVVLVAGCAAPVYVEKNDNVNLSNYRTYSWVDTRYTENDNSKRPPAYADASVRNAANEELSRAGWREVSDNADAYISYDVMVERTTARQSDPVYSQSFTRTYYNPRMRRWSTIYYPSQFLGYNSYDVPIREGTITITITDANTDKVIWQAWTTDELNYSRITADEIRSSVKNIFSKFDVASK